MAYKSIHEGFWTDPKLKKELKPLVRYLYSYFCTCPNSHFSGLYYLPKVTIMDETGLNRNELDRGMDTLIDRGILMYDGVNDVVFVVKMLKSQVKNANPNQKQKAGIVNHFHNLHNTTLINDFKTQWPHLELEFDIPIDTPIDRVSALAVIKQNKTKQDKTYSPNSDEVRMSELLFSLIRKRDPKYKPPDFQMWALHIDRIIRLDNRKVDVVEAVIRWCQSDEFWKDNILSTDALREKFGKLYLKMTTKKTNRPTETKPLGERMKDRGKEHQKLGMETT